MPILFIVLVLGLAFAAYSAEARWLKIFLICAMLINLSAAVTAYVNGDYRQFQEREKAQDDN